MKKLIASFAATTALLMGAEDTVTDVLFGAAADDDFGIFSMGADGVLTVNESIGKTEAVASLNLGGAAGAAGIFLVRMTLNGEQVGETLSETVAVGSVSKVKLSNMFDSLSGGDLIKVEFILDAAGSATDGGTVLTEGTANALAWSDSTPAKLEIFG
jgi:hypothetical protein